MRSKYNILIKALELATFLIVTHLSYYLSFVLRYQNDFFEENVMAYMNAAPYISVAIVLIIFATGYLDMAKKPQGEVFLKTVGVSFLMALATTFVVFYVRSFAFPRTIIAIGFFMMIVIFSCTKYLFVKLILKLRRRHKVVLVIPRESDTEFINKTITATIKFDDVVRIIYEDDKELLSLADIGEKIIVGERVSTIVKDQLIKWSLGKEKSVYIVPTMYEIAQMNAQLGQMVDVPFYRINQLNISLERRIAKRIFDLFFGCLFLLIACPIISIFAVLVKFQDGGRCFYTQKRVSYGRKEFDVIKLRTMVENAEGESGAVFAALDDVRITRLGAFMRKHRIDELPQFINVLKGDMSIVGPRPERPEFVSEFIQDIEGFEHRFLAKAGITGLAQVLGDYSTSASEKLKYDLIYIRNANVWFDFKMIIMTVKIVVLGLFHNKETFDVDLRTHLKKYGLKLKHTTYGYELETR
ncbi:MAG: sugar transferase [Tissierellales bacterium]|nr:sugar transferase [Tissierellales bacterium]